VIELQNLSAFEAEVERWFVEVEKAAGEAAVGLARVAFDYILENSPQYSGDFVANWKVGTSAGPEFTPDVFGKAALRSPFSRGSSPAIAYAQANANWPTPNLGQSIYIYNNAAHDEPYAIKIEQGQITFRPENEGAEAPVRKAALTVGYQYANIGPVQLDGLRKAEL